VEIDLGTYVVRSYRPEDAPSLAAAANNPKVAANLRDRFPHSYLYARVFEHNPASARVLEKCGFRLEGTLRRAVIKADKIMDLHLYSKLKDEPV
jgi:RimJ/RimL family protein N-acetyltransferase